MIRVKGRSVFVALVVGLALLAIFVCGVAYLEVGAVASVALVLYPLLAPLAALTFIQVEPEASEDLGAEASEELLALFADDDEDER